MQFKYLIIEPDGRVLFSATNTQEVPAHWERISDAKYDLLAANPVDLWFDRDLNKIIRKPVPDGKRDLTPLEFMELFEPEERKALRRLAKESEDIEDWLDLLRASTSVNKADPRLNAGLAAVVQLGVLTEARAIEVKAQL